MSKLLDEVLSYLIDVSKFVTPVKDISLYQLVSTDLASHSIPPIINL